MIIENFEPKTRQALFIRLYETAFPQVAAFIRKMGGDFEEAKDIFQDALVIYYEKTAEQDFTARVDEKAYLLGICRHLWYKAHHDNKNRQPLELSPELELLGEQEPKVSENLLRFIELSGKKCLDLLKGFYYDRLSMKELASRFGFSGERSATVQKYKCLEKIREAIQHRSLSKEDFYE